MNTIYISYSEVDEEWMRKLRVHLHPVARALNWTFWSGSEPNSESGSDKEADRAINSAGAVVLLLSRDYVNELLLSRSRALILEAARHRGVRIFAIAVRPTLVNGTPWAAFPTVNDINRPLSMLEDAELEQALDNIAQNISDALESTPKGSPVTIPDSYPVSKGVPKAGLFICYRREDTQDAAGRLHDRLTDAYGDDRVFMDIDSVPLGVDFVDHVTEQIGRCTAVIVMIGRQWLTTEDKRGRKRLETESDLVRVEVSAALQRKIPVIPVLVQDADMPRADDLPDDIRLLARRNGIELSATRWKTDVERLIKELDRVMKG